MGRDERGHYFDSVKQSVAATQQIAVPYSVKQDGLSTVTFSLTDHEGVVRWRSAPYPVAVPPVSAALKQAEAAIGDALVAWAQLPAGPDKQAYDKQLADLLTAWGYLDKRYQKREHMTASELEALLAQVELINQQAQLTRQQMTPSPD